MRHEDEPQQNSIKSKRGYFLLCEVLILTPVVLVIIGLFSIPTILYALQEIERSVGVANTIYLH
jgi:hypothetical protein